MERHAQRRAAGRGASPDPVQHLPGPAGQFRRDSSDPGIHPRRCAGSTTLRTARWQTAIAQRPQARRPGRGAGAAQAAARPAQPGSARSGLPAAALRAVRRRSPPRVHRTQGRSRGDQSSASRGSCVTTSSWNCPQDKTLITHARTGAASSSATRSPSSTADHKVTGGRRAVNGVIGLRVPTDVIKAKCAPYLKRGKPERRTRLINRRRPHDRQHLRGRVPGPRPVLPAGRRRLATEPAALGHGDLDAEDAGRQARLDGVEDGPQVQGHHRHPARAAHLLPGQRRTRQAGNHWSHGSAASPSNGRRTRSSTDRRPAPVTTRRKELITRLLSGPVRAVRADRPTVQVHHVRKLADLTQPGRPQPAWAQLMAKRRTQDPRGLPPLPRQHPRAATHRDTHGVITGEPVRGNGARAVRRGPPEKDLHQQAPRRRPTGTLWDPDWGGAFWKTTAYAPGRCGSGSTGTPGGSASANGRVSATPPWTTAFVPAMTPRRCSGSVTGWARAR